VCALLVDQAAAVFDLRGAKRTDKGPFPIRSICVRSYAGPQLLPERIDVHALRSLCKYRNI